MTDITPENIAYRVQRLERSNEDQEDDLKKMGERIDRLTLAVVGFALTLAVFGLGIAVTLLTAGSG